MKRKLSLLMAFMMAATLVPAQPSFAASANATNKVVTATSDDTLDATTGVVLILAREGETKVGPQAGEYFELKLAGDAKWNYSSSVRTPADNAEVMKLTDSILGVWAKGGDISIPMLVNLNGTAEGAQKVTVVPKNSSVSSGEYSYATVGASSIKLRVEKKEKISRSGDTKVQLIIDEMTQTSFDGKPIKLKLPKDFAWGSKEDAESTGLADGTSVEIDGRFLEFTPKQDNSELQSVYINIPVVPGRDARYGDVDVTVQGSADVSPSSLVIAEYVPYDVMVKAEKVLNVIAGKDIEGLYKSKLTIEEPATASLQGKRYMEFKFVDENGKDVKASLQDGETLKLTRKSGDSNVDLKIDGASINAKKDAGVDKKVESYTVSTDKDTRADEFDLYVDSQSKTTKAKYELEVPFVVASDFTGKLYLQVKGAGVDEQKVQIADVKAPVTFEVNKPLPQVKIGLQKQKGSDIAIKETEAGALQDYVPGGNKNYAEYTIVPEQNFALTFKSVDYKLDGNLGIKKVDTTDSDKGIFVQVDRKSTKASTITLNDITVTLDRTVPYGEIKLKGNFGVVKSRHDLTNKVKAFEYFTTVTPVANDKRVTTVFTIGQKGYTEVMGNVKEEMTADVAPFIENGRTMLPVRYVANALSASVNYDVKTRVATFQKDQVVVSINIDKDIMYVNGSPVALDAKPANVESRIFLPVANIAQAFGLKHGQNIIWNQEAKTVTILPQDATAEEIKEAQDGKVLENAVTKEEANDKKDEEKKADDKKADDQKTDSEKSDK